MTEIRGQKSEVGGPWSVVGKAILVLTLCALLRALPIYPSAAAEEGLSDRVYIVGQYS